MALNDCVADPTLELEAELLLGADIVIGMDEVGRGALAGPVAVGVQVVAADTGDYPTGLRDSKLLSARQRERLFPAVLEWGTGAVGTASPETIDADGIMPSLGMAGRDALLRLADAGVELSDAVVILDGNYDWLTPQLDFPLRVVTVVGADRACASVAAASVRAKVTRDRLLVVAAAEYPEYGWDTNKGYGSKAHTEAIKKYGVTPLHRVTWVKQR